MTRADVSVEKIVLIRLPKQIYYVSKVTGVSDGEFEVSFLRKNLKFSNCFLFPDIPDTSFVTSNDIVMVLPDPVPGTTKRQSKLYKFRINFSSV